MTEMYQLDKRLGILEKEMEVIRRTKEENAKLKIRDKRQTDYLLSHLGESNFSSTFEEDLSTDVVSELGVQYSPTTVTIGLTSSGADIETSGRLDTVWSSAIALIPEYDIAGGAIQAVGYNGAAPYYAYYFDLDLDSDVPDGFYNGCKIIASSEEGGAGYSYTISHYDAALNRAYLAVTPNASIVAGWFWVMRIHRGEIVILDGEYTYYGTTSMKIPSGVSVRGMGIGATTVRSAYNASSNTMFGFGSWPSYIGGHIKISDMTLASKYATYSVAFLLAGTTSFTTFERMEFLSHPGSSGYGMVQLGTDNWGEFCVRNIFRNCLFEARIVSDAGVAIERGYDCLVDNCTLLNCGINVAYGARFTLSNCFIEGGVFRTFYGEPYTLIINNLFLNPRYNTSAIYLYQSARCKVLNNTVHTEDGAYMIDYAIAILAQASGALVSGNDFMGQGATKSIYNLSSSTQWGAGNRVKDGTWKTGAY